MKVDDNIVRSYIEYFFTKIVGFNNQEVRYITISQNDNEFLSIAMDKVDRLVRKSGRLRNRVWNNCYFIFHDNTVESSVIFKQKVAQIKKDFPFLFIRSYVYFVFINVLDKDLLSSIDEAHQKLETKHFKIWYFNSKYEVKEEIRRANIFGISLDEGEKIDDYMYIANPKSELQRIESANSDAIDCVRAFTGNLELLGQTSQMLELVCNELDTNSNARILVEGPARSGKTIIAASLLGQYENSKFLLMNFFFYQAIVDGFYALSGWDRKEIEELVKNPELEALQELEKSVPKLLASISRNLEYAIKESIEPKDTSNTKEWLIENIEKLNDGRKRAGFEYNDLSGLKWLNALKDKLYESNSEHPFVNINRESLHKVKKRLDDLLSGKYESLQKLQENIVDSIEEIKTNSKQRFFHHNINSQISTNVSEGCWIKRGNPTTSKIWGASYRPQLIICDEVQRLGVIPQYGSYDEFDEISQILKNSDQSFFTGDNYQMLNSLYDKGIEEISNRVLREGQHLSKYVLPESVGVPAEIGMLMKCLTHPNEVPVDLVASNWSGEKDFEITFINGNVDKLVKFFDEDNSNKKHFSAPLDSNWIDFEVPIQIETPRRENPIIPIKDHEKDNFSYKFPYFCNEEIMPNYLLSAYELISREVESLYVHIPNFVKMKNEHLVWYRKHLYVLFTRPTSRLIVNMEVKAEFEQMKHLIKLLEDKGAKLSISFLS